jgi:hypothetical protein
MNPELKKKIQIVLALAIAVAGIRAGYIVYTRHSGKMEQAAKQPLLLNPDYYVTPKKLYPYDLMSARQLTNQPVWVKEGYRYTYYPYDTVRHHTDFSHEAGLLLPIEKLEIKDVAADVATGNQHVVMAVFAKEAKTYALQVGVVQGNGYEIYSDEIFFIQDPRDLYKHWPEDVWESIEKHEVKTGMNEFQADFAIGIGIPERSSNPAVKTVNYPNGGKPVSITYRDGKAVEIRRSSGM